jgi:hypothetical protein
MLEAFPLVVPSLQGRTVATVRPVHDARYGLVIIGDPRDPLPAWPELYTELALYIQSAGLSVLRLDYRQPEHMNMRAFDLLDAVNALRTQGVERVLVVSRARGGPAGTFGAGPIIPSFLRSVLSMSHSAGEVAEQMGRLIDTISGAVESIAGTVAILTPAQERPPTARHVLRQRMLDAATRTSTHTATRSAGDLAIVAPRPGELVLRVGGEVRDEWRTHLIETIYGWCTEQVRGAGASPKAADRDVSYGQVSEPRAGGRKTVVALREAQHWLEERWVDIVGDMMARHPHWAEEVADRTKTGTGQAGIAGTSLLEARHVWRHLDAKARDEWMAACSQLVRILAATSGEYTPPASAPASMDK